jgi:hypothetical protein
MSRREAVLGCVFVALVSLMCVGVLTAAALVPAPAVLQPFVVVVCVGLAMAAASELPEAIAALRRSRVSSALDALKRQLDKLPETEHPLGL